MKQGTLGILNVGAGDTKLSFDKSNPAERIRAARIVKDMLRRGYALLIEIDDGKGGKTHQRALDFDENACEYIIADFDPVTAQRVDALEVAGGKDITIEIEPRSTATEEVGAPVVAEKPIEAPRGRRGRRKRVAAEGVRGVAVSRTAGG